MTVRSQTAYYNALGIDVWVRRRPRAGMARTSSPTSRESAAPSDARPSTPVREQAPEAQPRRSRPPEPAPPPVLDAPAPEEAFRVRCFRYGRVFAALAEDAWPMRHLLLDVAWALNDFRTAERDDLVFDWPQPGAVADAGGKAFGAFFRHQTRFRGASRTLISGVRVATLLGHPPPAESCVLNGGLYVRPGTLHNRAKRELWRLIQDLTGKS